MPAAPPAFDTDRLILRPHRVEDFPDTRAMWGDPVVTKYIGGRPFTEEECWQRLLRYAGHWALLGFGFWTVRERASGRFVGEVGLLDGKRQIDPPFDGAPELGWALAPSAHGKGYATEAVRGALGWAARHFGPKVRTVCMIDPGNLASLRVAEKCGFREYARSTYKGEPSILFERIGEPAP
jgi:RimJ/RimL family protein N-acetyltransferase